MHHRLDDEFPELTDALLEVLYPHYLAPVPSCAVVQFSRSRICALPVQVPRQIAASTPSRCGPALPVPHRLADDALAARNREPAPFRPAARRAGQSARSRAVAVLRIALRCTSPDMTFGELGVDRLRFFLRGAPAVSLPLYELLCGHASVSPCGWTGRSGAGLRCRPKRSSRSALRRMRHCSPGPPAASPASGC